MLCVVCIQVGVSVKIIAGRNSSVRFRLPVWRRQMIRSGLCFDVVGDEDGVVAS